MGAKKKAGAAGRAAALPKPWEFVPRDPVGDESVYTVGAEMFRDWVAALKTATNAEVCDLRIKAHRAVQQVSPGGRGERVADAFMSLLVTMAASAIKSSGDVTWCERQLQSSRFVDDLKAKQKAEAVARLAAGRKAAAERRAIAVLAQFPRGVGVSA